MRGAAFEPYGKTLGGALTKAGVASEVWSCGLCGFTAHEMVAEINDRETHADAVWQVGTGLAWLLDNTDPLPDLVLIMAGTNDLRKGIDAHRTLLAVKELHLACHARGVATIALAAPLPQRGRQQKFSKLLRSWCAQQPSVQAFFDPEEILQRGRGSRYWEADTLHFTAHGSKQLATKLAGAIAPMLLASIPAYEVPTTPTIRAKPEPDWSQSFPYGITMEACARGRASPTPTKKRNSRSSPTPTEQRNARSSPTPAEQRNSFLSPATQSRRPSISLSGCQRDQQRMDAALLSPTNRALNPACALAAVLSPVGAFSPVASRRPSQPRRLFAPHAGLASPPPTTRLQHSRRMSAQQVRDSSKVQMAIPRPTSCFAIPRAAFASPQQRLAVVVR